MTFDGPVFFQYTYVVLCSGQVKYKSKFSLKSLNLDDGYQM